MHILACHNFYQQAGGEDQSFRQEIAQLESHGHRVSIFSVHNDEIHQMSSAEAVVRSIWNNGSYKEIRRLLQAERIDILHCTNTFPLMSPSVYYGARKEGVPVVQSLRNYRLLCPGACFVRDGKVCEKCLGKQVPWPAIVHGCYRHNRLASAAVVSMLALHRAAGTWTKLVDVYYALTEFSRRKFIEGGLPADLIEVKPNSVFPEPAVGTGQGNFCIFVGRLAPEKGIDTLLNAWSMLKGAIPLKLIGDGPQRNLVLEATRRDPRIEWLGRKSEAEVLALVGEATCLIMPSVWYEGFPRTIAEAYVKGTPVVASKLGSMTELITDAETGLHFDPGNANDLAVKVARVWSHGEARTDWRVAARRRYDQYYSSEVSYQCLMRIYDRAIARKQSRMNSPMPKEK